MFERFTHEARLVVVGAQEHARDTYSDHIRPEHLLLGALAADGALFSRMGVDPKDVTTAVHELRGTAGLDQGDIEALRHIGIDAEEVAQRLNATGSTPRQRNYGHIPFARKSKKTLELALRQAVSLGDKHIGVEHILLGLTMVGGAVGDVLTRFGLDTESVRGHLSGQDRRTG